MSKEEAIYDAVVAAYEAYDEAYETAWQVYLKADGPDDIEWSVFLKAREAAWEVYWSVHDRVVAGDIV